MSSNALFSVIIPTYNRGYILWKTIQIVQKQTFEDWELLVIDDGSTDDTKKVVREFQSDSRIHYFYKLNGGAYAARNLGLASASGEFITYVDSDDQVFSDYLETAKDCLEKHPEKSFAMAKARRFLEYYDEEGFLKASKQENFEIVVPRMQDFYNWSVKASIGTGFFTENLFRLSGTKTFIYSKIWTLLCNVDW